MIITAKEVKTLISKLASEHGAKLQYQFYFSNGNYQYMESFDLLDYYNAYAYLYSTEFEMLNISIPVEGEDGEYTNKKVVPIGDKKFELN